MAEKNMCCGTCTTCGVLMSLFVMAAGLAILMASFGKLDVATANLVAGAGLTLFGIGKLVHKLGMCPMCKC